jgi:hydroxymethylpyrimidine pyrophosphatase-like HAD family hydrolase
MRILNTLGIAAENVLAFGDGENDAEMLRAAGYGIAMSNGMPAALGAANFITASNDEGGVGLFLNQVFGMGLQ